MILNFFSSAGWQEWDVERRPLIPDGMPVLVDDDLVFEDGPAAPRVTTVVNRWLRELPTSGAPAHSSWANYARIVKAWMEFLAVHDVEVFDSRERLKAALGRYAEHRSAGPLEERFAPSTWSQHMSVLSLFYRLLARSCGFRVVGGRRQPSDAAAGGAMGAAPSPGILTIDPEATWIETSGRKKEGAAFSYNHEVGLSPMVGVVGETGDVVGIRARGGKANAGRAMGSFVEECVGAIPKEIRGRSQLWLRVDSAGYEEEMVDAAERHNMVFTITAKKTTRVQAAIVRLATDPTTVWLPAIGAEEDKGSEIAECDFCFAGRKLRMIVRRQPTRAGDQLCFDDLDGWRFHAIITCIQAPLRSAAEVEHHHRLRGGGPEEAIRQLKGDFGLCHAPVQNFFGNWLWWHAAALAYNVARWLRTIALPAEFASCRGKRLRLAFLNVAAKVVRTGRRVVLRLPRAYRHARAFAAALATLRALPRFA